MKTALTKFKQYLETRHPGRSTAKHYMNDLAILRIGQVDIEIENQAILIHAHWPRTEMAFSTFRHHHDQYRFGDI